MSIHSTVGGAVRAARKIQMDVDGDYGVGVAVPAGVGTHERFVQWSDVSQSSAGWTVGRIEASVEDPAVQGHLRERGFQPDESLSQYHIWVDESSQPWASEAEMLDRLCLLLELLGATDGVALTVYP